MGYWTEKDLERLIGPKGAGMAWDGAATDLIGALQRALEQGRLPFAAPIVLSPWQFRQYQLWFIQRLSWVPYAVKSALFEQLRAASISSDRPTPSLSEMLEKATRACGGKDLAARILAEIENPLVSGSALEAKPAAGTWRPYQAGDGTGSPTVGDQVRDRHGWKGVVSAVISARLVKVRQESQGKTVWSFYPPEELEVWEANPDAFDAEIAYLRGEGPEPSHGMWVGYGPEWPRLGERVRHRVTGVEGRVVAVGPRDAGAAAMAEVSPSPFGGFTRGWVEIGKLDLWVPTPSHEEVSAATTVPSIQFNEVKQEDRSMQQGMATAGTGRVVADWRRYSADRGPKVGDLVRDWKAGTYGLVEPYGLAGYVKVSTGTNGQYGTIYKLAAIEYRQDAEDLAALSEAMGGPYHPGSTKALEEILAVRAALGCKAEDDVVAAAVQCAREASADYRIGRIEATRKLLVGPEPPGASSLVHLGDLVENLASVLGVAEGHTIMEAVENLQRQADGPPADLPAYFHTLKMVRERLGTPPGVDTVCHAQEIASSEKSKTRVLEEVREALKSEGDIVVDATAAAEAVAMVQSIREAMKIPPGADVLVTLKAAKQSMGELVEEMQHLRVVAGEVAPEGVHSGGYPSSLRAALAVENALRALKTRVDVGAEAVSKLDLVRRAMGCPHGLTYDVVDHASKLARVRQEIDDLAVLAESIAPPGTDSDMAPRRTASRVEAVLKTLRDRQLVTTNVPADPRRLVWRPASKRPDAGDVVRAARPLTDVMAGSTYDYGIIIETAIPTATAAGVDTAVLVEMGGKRRYMDWRWLEAREDWDALRENLALVEMRHLGDVARELAPEVYRLPDSVSSERIAVALERVLRSLKARAAVAGAELLPGEMKELADLARELDPEVAEKARIEAEAHGHRAAAPVRAVLHSLAAKVLTEGKDWAEKAADLAGQMRAMQEEAERKDRLREASAKLAAQVREGDEKERQRIADFIEDLKGERNAYLFHSVNLRTALASVRQSMSVLGGPLEAIETINAVLGAEQPGSPKTELEKAYAALVQARDALLMWEERDSVEVDAEAVKAIDKVLGNWKATESALPATGDATDYRHTAVRLAKKFCGPAEDHVDAMIAAVRSALIQHEQHERQPLSAPDLGPVLCGVWGTPTKANTATAEARWMLSQDDLWADRNIPLGTVFEQAVAFARELRDTQNRGSVPYWTFEVRTLAWQPLDETTGLPAKSDLRSQPAVPGEWPELLVSRDDLAHHVERPSCRRADSAPSSAAHDVHYVALKHRRQAPELPRAVFKIPIPEEARTYALRTAEELEKLKATIRLALSLDGWIAARRILREAAEAGALTPPPVLAAAPGHDDRVDALRWTTSAERLLDGLALSSGRVLPTVIEAGFIEVDPKLRAEGQAMFERGENRLCEMLKASLTDVLAKVKVDRSEQDARHNAYERGLTKGLGDTSRTCLTLTPSGIWHLNEAHERFGAGKPVVPWLEEQAERFARDVVYLGTQPFPKRDITPEAFLAWFHRGQTADVLRGSPYGLDWGGSINLGIDPAKGGDESAAFVTTPVESITPNPDNPRQSTDAAYREAYMRGIRKVDDFRGFVCFWPSDHRDLAKAVEQFASGSHAPDGIPAWIEQWAERFARATVRTARALGTPAVLRLTPDQFLAWWHQGRPGDRPLVTIPIEVKLDLKFTAAEEIPAGRVVSFSPPPILAPLAPLGPEERAAYERGIDSAANGIAHPLGSMVWEPADEEAVAQALAEFKGPGSPDIATWLETHAAHYATDAFEAARKSGKKPIIVSGPGFLAWLRAGGAGRPEASVTSEFQRGWREASYAAAHAIRAFCDSRITGTSKRAKSVRKAYENAEEVARVLADEAPAQPVSRASYAALAQQRLERVQRLERIETAAEAFLGATPEEVATRGEAGTMKLVAELAGAVCGQDSDRATELRKLAKDLAGGPVPEPSNPTENAAKRIPAEYHGDDVWVLVESVSREPWFAFGSDESAKKFQATGCVGELRRFVPIEAYGKAKQDEDTACRLWMAERDLREEAVADLEKVSKTHKALVEAAGRVAEMAKGGSFQWTDRRQRWLDLFALLGAQDQEVGVLGAYHAVAGPPPWWPTGLKGSSKGGCDCRWTGSNGARHDGTIEDGVPGFEPCAGHLAWLKQAIEKHDARHAGRDAATLRVVEAAEKWSDTRRGSEEEFSAGIDLIEALGDLRDGPVPMPGGEEASNKLRVAKARIEELEDALDAAEGELDEIDEIDEVLGTGDTETTAEAVERVAGVVEQAGVDAPFIKAALEVVGAYARNEARPTYELGEAAAIRQSEMEEAGLVEPVVLRGHLVPDAAAPAPVPTCPVGNGEDDEIVYVPAEGCSSEHGLWRLGTEGSPGAWCRVISKPEDLASGYEPIRYAESDAVKQAKKKAERYGGMYEVRPLKPYGIWGDPGKSPGRAGWLTAKRYTRRGAIDELAALAALVAPSGTESWTVEPIPEGEEIGTDNLFVSLPAEEPKTYGLWCEPPTSPPNGLEPGWLKTIDRKLVLSTKAAAESHLVGMPMGPHYWTYTAKPFPGWGVWTEPADPADPTDKRLVAGWMTDDFYATEEDAVRAAEEDNLAQADPNRRAPRWKMTAKPLPPDGEPRPHADAAGGAS